MEKLRFYFQHSLNDLRVNGQRTFFALLCIAAGVAAIVSLLTLSHMIEDTLTGSLQESNRGDLRFSPIFAFTSDDRIDAAVDAGLLHQEGQFSALAITPAGLEALQSWFSENYPGSYLTYRHLTPDSFNAAINLSHPAKDTDATFVTPYIVDAANYPVYGQVRSEDGDRLSEMITSPTDIVLSRNLADELDAKVGDQIRVAGIGQDFTVRGIVPTDEEGGLLNIVNGLFGFYYIDFATAELFSNIRLDHASEVYIRLRDPNQVDEAAEALKAAHPYLNISTTTQLEQSNTTFSNVIDDMVVIMGLVSLLIGGIGIINTMLVIVSRRSTEIAVLKTLGLEPQEVTLLFLTQAIIMGVIGSILGVLLGWLMAFVVQGIAENFLGQSLAYRLSVRPAGIGLIVGVIITCIFGFLPTLAAGQVRPATVLRPSEAVLPRAGRLRSFITLVALALVLSLVVQGLMGDLLNNSPTIGSLVDSLAELAQNTDPNAEVSTSEDINSRLADIRIINLITAVIGGVYGLILGVSIPIAGIASIRAERRGRSWLLYGLIWVVGFFGFPIFGALFGYNIPAVLLITVTVLIISYLYVTLWLLIWAVGGGRPSEIFPGVLALLFPLFWPLIPVLIVLLLPMWLLGWFIQRYTFIDLKVAMRAMLANKARGASTLVALAVGIFTLSVITMLVDTVTNAFSRLLEEELGGDAIIFTAGGDDSIEEVTFILNEHPGVESFAAVRSYGTELISYQDAETGETLTMSDLESRARAVNSFYGDFLSLNFTAMDARELDSNLPNVRFSSGRNLSPTLDTQPDADGYWPVVVTGVEDLLAAGIKVGDLFTFAISGDPNDTLTFRVVGITDQSGGSVSGASEYLYAPIQAFGDREADNFFIIANIEESSIAEVRRAVSEVPGTFFLEVRFINDLLNRIINQLTSFPILVAALALFTGGVVIANSVALSTLERRREIGIMKAVGLQRERVLLMLLLENGLMGLISGLIGVGISFLALLLMLRGLFGGDLGDIIPYQTAFGLMSLCIGIALFAAILSVWRASGEKPLNVLRYE